MRKKRAGGGEQTLEICRKSPSSIQENTDECKCVKKLLRDKERTA